MMNEETGQFERRLSRQPLKKIPGEWRAEILTAARDVQATRHPSPATRHSLLSNLNHQLSTILWPHPKAWAGLAAVWVFILAVNFTARDHSEIAAKKSAPPSPEAIAELRQQKLLFAQLIGSGDAREIELPRLFLPRPRTERRFETLAA